MDGTRAAWQQSPVGGSADNTFSLLASALTGGTPGTLADKAIQLRLKDGVLAWMETPTTMSRALQSSAGGSTRTLSSLSTANLLANGGGWVVYVEAGKPYSSNSATECSKLRLDVSPTQAFAAGGAVVFTVGTAVYRVGLD